MLLYAKSLGEVSEMLRLLHSELASIGLQMHADKTKILTTIYFSSKQFVHIGDMRIEVLHPTAQHKYLGRQLCLDASIRTRIEVENRCKIGWGRFHQCRKWLTHTHIPVEQRLKYSESVVKPAALFGLHILPLSLKDLHHIASMQRRMLRLVVGWRRQTDEPWADTMRRMRNRVQRALSTTSSSLSWEQSLLKQQLLYALHAKFGKAGWPRVVARWHPDGVRNVGRPRLRWDDHLNKFLKTKHGCGHWMYSDRHQLLTSVQSFIHDVLGD